MSFFNHSSTPQKLTDNVARFRYTETPVEGGSSSLTQGNQIKFRFSSNQDSWHAPSCTRKPARQEIVFFGLRSHVQRGGGAGRANHNIVGAGGSWDTRI